MCAPSRPVQPQKGTMAHNNRFPNNPPRVTMGPSRVSQSSPPKTPFHLESSLEKELLLSRMRATIYGNCIGDAIGLLTEFMTKQEAQEIYGKPVKDYGFMDSKNYTPIEKLELEYNMRYNDRHRSHWKVGDWTDDSDQMILILRMLLDHSGKVDIFDYAEMFKVWIRNGYPELGDDGGMGIGSMTSKVVKKRNFTIHPHKCAYQVWDESGRWAAPNGGVMRTSILGIQDFSDIPTVIHNTRQICKVTHADPRCIASCVAVTTAIALMLQGKHCKGHGYDEQAICKEAYKNACEELQTEEEIKDLHRHMFAKTLSELELSDNNKIGYTFKCLGAGFWAYRQKDFRLALTELVMEAGDADTNGAVAGALLGCKLGVEYLPETWLNGLLHKDWLDPQIDRYFVMLGLENENEETMRLQRSQQMEIDGLRATLFAQTRAREESETAKRLYSSEKRSRELEASLTAQRQSREDAERRLYSSQQRLQELETSLASQTQAIREEIERRFYSSQQRLQELETSLAAQTQAIREEIERRFYSREQRLQKLETSLAAQIKARDETERRLYSSEKRLRELERILAAQTQAREETEKRLHSSDQRLQKLETSLAAQTKARDETERRLYSSEQRLRGLERILAAQTQARSRQETERRLYSREQRSHNWKDN